MQGRSIGRLNTGAAVAATGAGAAVKVSGCKKFTFTVTGDFSGTLLIQGSVVQTPDGGNADHWFDLHSFAAKGHQSVVDKPCEWIRYNCTVRTSGSADIDHVGL